MCAFAFPCCSSQIKGPPPILAPKGSKQQQKKQAKESEEMEED